MFQTIRSRLILMTLTLGVFTLIAGAAGFFGLTEVGVRVHDLSERRIPLFAKTGEITASLLRAINALESYRSGVSVVSTADEQIRKHALSQYEASIADLADNLERFQSDQPEIMADVTEARRLFVEEFKPTAEHVQKAGSEMLAEDGRADLAMEEMEAAYDSIGAASGRLERAIDALVKRSIEQAFSPSEYVDIVESVAPTNNLVKDAKLLLAESRILLEEIGQMSSAANIRMLRDAYTDNFAIFRSKILLLKNGGDYNGYTLRRLSNPDALKALGEVEAEADKFASSASNMSAAQLKLVAQVDDMARAIEHLEQTDQAMATLVGSLRQKAQRAVDQSQEVVDSEERAALVVIVLVLLGAIVIGGGVSGMITRSVGGALHQAGELAAAVADGDLSRRIDTSRKGEVGEVLAALANMQARLSEVIGKIHVAASSLESEAGQLSAVTRDQEQAIGQQQSRQHQVSGSVGQLSSASDDIARAIADVSAAASEASAIASRGRAVVEQTIEGIKRVSTEVGEVGEVVNTLETQSNEIGTILDVIREIAEQTNLLALNAAIEAARAGEQGRGFAVVADEVRTLATRTGSSVDQIANMINGLQRGVKHASEVMDSGRQRVEEVVGRATTAGESLNEIDSAVGRIDGLASQVASAAEEQNAITDEVNGAVNESSALLEQVVSSSRQTSSASESLTRLARDLAAQANRFRLG